MSVIKVVLHLLVCLLLAATAALQFNDPDPWFWAGFYGICALVPLTAALKADTRYIYAVCVVYGIVALVLSGPGFLEYLEHARTESLLQAMGPGKPYIEEAREFIGAAIALVLISLYPLFRRNPKKDYLFLK